MFLNESYLYEADDVSDVKTDDFESGDLEEAGGFITADPATFMEAMYFAEKAWNNLSMKMVRLEHTSIVNNDSRLMQEGVRDFGKKVVQWFKDMWAKIKAFVDRVVTRIHNMIDDSRAKKFAGVANGYNGKGKISAGTMTNFRMMTGKVVRDMIELANRADVLSSNPETAQARIQELRDAKVADAESQGGREVAVTDGDVKAAFKFVTGERRTLMSSLQKAKAAAQKTANEGIKAAGKGNQEEIKKYRQGLNSINTVIAQLVRILNAGVTASLRILGVAARNQKGSTGSSAGVLDQF